MELALIIGITLTFNIIILFIKYNSGRYIDLIFDISLLLIIGTITSGTIAGFTGGMIASTIISLFLMFKTPKIITDLQDDDDDTTNKEVTYTQDLSPKNSPFVFQFN